MVELDIEKNEYGFSIVGDYINTLDMRGFFRMMKNPSSCYKFYWLEAIVDLITRDVKETTYDEIINEMICNAWYSVREFHIHLSGLSSNGDVKDALERAVLKLAKVSVLNSNATKEEVRNAIVFHEAELKAAKNQLTNMVPYYALSGFFVETEWYDEWVKANSIRRKVAYINAFNREHGILPYDLGESDKLKKEVLFSDKWIQMIQNNESSIYGWIQYEKVRWLQSNNPEVPGLVYKLRNTDDKIRKLGNVRRLWEGIFEYTEVRDVFTDEPVSAEKYDVDHFIPRSFVMNDELWNLSPMDDSLNSKKNNKLPKWDPFFEHFAYNQYLMYEFIHKKPEIHKRFETCFRDNLHSIWAGQELYRPGNTRDEFYDILQKNMRPIYDSAKRQGYEVWNAK